MILILHFWYWGHRRLHQQEIKSFVPSGPLVFWITTLDRAIWGPGKSLFPTVIMDTCLWVLSIHLSDWVLLLKVPFTRTKFQLVAQQTPPYSALHALQHVGVFSSPLGMCSWPQASGGMFSSIQVRHLIRWLPSFPEHYIKCSISNANGNIFNENRSLHRRDFSHVDLFLFPRKSLLPLGEHLA
jgi:hypothetical protein